MNDSNSKISRFDILGMIIIFLLLANIILIHRYFKISYNSKLYNELAFYAGQFYGGIDSEQALEYLAEDLKIQLEETDNDE